MTADTLRASLLFVAEDPASCANNPTLSDLLREAAKAIATPELIALGEAAVAYEEVRNRLTSPMSVAQRTARVDAELALTLAARAHAASVASIPSTTVGDNRT